MRDRRRAAALGAAAGYGLSASVFTTFLVAWLMDLRTLGRVGCAATTVAVLMIATVVTWILRGRDAARRR